MHNLSIFSCYIEMFHWFIILSFDIINFYFINFTDIRCLLRANWHLVCLFWNYFRILTYTLNLLLLFLLSFESEDERIIFTHYISKRISVRKRRLDYNLFILNILKHVIERGFVQLWQIFWKSIKLWLPTLILTIHYHIDWF